MAQKPPPLPPVERGTLQYSRGRDRVERAVGLPPDQRREVLNAVLAVFFVPALLAAAVVLVLLAVR